MSSGRTTWYATDAAEHDRELIVELGEEFGPGGPYVIRVLKDLAQQQTRGADSKGRVRTGFRSLGRKAFIEADAAQRIVSYAAQIGALDDLDTDADGRRFTCRISGWEADQSRGRSAFKKAAYRARQDNDVSTPEVDTSTPEVPESPMFPAGSPTRPDNRNPSTSSSASDELDQARESKELFGYWQEQCGHPTAKPTRDRLAKVRSRLNEGYTPAQIRQAIDGAARAAFVNDAGRRFDDLELICRNGSKLEDFIGRSGPPVPIRTASSRDIGRALRGDPGGGAA